MNINTDANQIVTLLAPLKMVLTLDEELKEASFGTRTDEMIPDLYKGIRVDAIHYAYPGGRSLFNGLSALFPAGKMSGIVGPSGSGKTTLIDLVAGLLKPRTGNIFIDDKPLDDDIMPAWKSSIGYLPQDAFFIDGTIRENLVWDSSQRFTDEEIWEALKSVNADELVRMQKDELDTIIVNHQYFFSGGERQRLALARILLRKPRVLLLDEATSSLDEENEKQIMEVLRSLKGQVTILFVTHRTSILPWCDEIVRLD